MNDTLVKQMLKRLRRFIFKIHQQKTLAKTPNTLDFNCLHLNKINKVVTPDEKIHVTKLRFDKDFMSLEQ